MWGTFAVNAVGSLLAGAVAGVLLHGGFAWSGHPALRALLLTGFLGGFTTFSAYALDAVSLVERGAPWVALLYVLATVALCLVCAWAGLQASRALVLALAG